MYFKTQRHAKAVEKSLGGRAYLAYAKGNADQNRQYIKGPYSKDGKEKPENETFIERGEIPSQGKRNDIVATKNAIRGSKRMRDTHMEDEHANSWAKYPKYCEQVLSFTQEDLAKEMYQNGIFPTIHVRWSRQSGTGKTRHVWEFSNCDVIRAKYAQNIIWFDGYDGHKHILFDEFHPNECKISPSTFLEYIDIYPIQLPVKGGFKWRLAEHIWITSNEPPEEWWPWLTEDRRSCLLRRLTDVTEVLPQGA